VFFNSPIFCECGRNLKVEFTGCACRTYLAVGDRPLAYYCDWGTLPGVPI
jgi:hypothetical protein